MDSLQCVMKSQTATRQLLFIKLGKSDYLLGFFTKGLNSPFLVQGTQQPTLLRHREEPNPSLIVQTILKNGQSFASLGHLSSVV